MVTDSSDRPWAQFRLRHMMIALACVAVVAAAVAAVTRSWPAPKQSLFAAGLGALCLVCAIHVAPFAWWRRRVERAAGRLLLRQPRADRRVRPAVFYGVWGLIGVPQLVFSLLDWYQYVGFNRALQSGPWFLILVFRGIRIEVIGLMVLALWWGPTAWLVQFREHGIVHCAFYGYLHFVRWSDVVGHEWHDGKPSTRPIGNRSPRYDLSTYWPAGDLATLQLILTGNRSVNLPFDSKHRAAAEEVVSQCMASARQDEG